MLHDNLDLFGAPIDGPDPACPAHARRRKISRLIARAYDALEPAGSILIIVLSIWLLMQAVDLVAAAFFGVQAR